MCGLLWILKGFRLSVGCIVIRFLERSKGRSFTGLLSSKGYCTVLGCARVPEGFSALGFSGLANQLGCKGGLGIQVKIVSSPKFWNRESTRKVRAYSQAILQGHR